MEKYWRKWSYEAPLALGDALWEVLVVQLADFLSRLTIRRVLEFLVIAILVMAFAQTAPIDLAFLFAGDTLMYLEFVLFVRLAAGREFFRYAMRLAMRFAGFATRMLRAAIDRSLARIQRPRAWRSPARPAKRRNSDQSDDGPGLGAAWDELATA